MKITTFLTTMALTLSLSQAFALTIDEQRDAVRELEAARAEINLIRSLVPRVLERTIGAGLLRAEQRIGNAQIILALTDTDRGGIICTIESTFDGQFLGRGQTQIEAEFAARSACKAASRNEGLFCKDDTLRCSGN